MVLIFDSLRHSRGGTRHRSCPTAPQAAPDRLSEEYADEVDVTQQRPGATHRDDHWLAPLILTLRLASPAFERFDALRRAHFPPERNVIPAHLTLFHALPGEREADIGEVLAATCAATAPLALRFPSLRFLGRGVAAEVVSPELLALRGKLAARWDAWLSAQDRQGYRPHITIQNKVSAEQARRLHAELAAAWEPFESTGDGLLLWRYLGGPWELVRDEPFASQRR